LLAVVTGLAPARLSIPRMALIDPMWPPGQAPIQGALADRAKARGQVVPTKPPPPALDGAQIIVQGGALRTWSYNSPAIEQAKIALMSDGGQIEADIELWRHGPGNVPLQMSVYAEDGLLRPFSAVIETPPGHNTVACRNIGQLEFPFTAEVAKGAFVTPSDELLSSTSIVDGGAIRTYPFDASVDSVEILLKTDGRPLTARIELLQGPNNNKQVIELYTEDGDFWPFFCVLETPGFDRSVVQIVSTGPVEFPLHASVVPHSINQQTLSSSAAAEPDERAAAAAAAGNVGSPPPSGAAEAANGSGATTDAAAAKLAEQAKEAAELMAEQAKEAAEEAEAIAKAAAQAEAAAKAAAEAVAKAKAEAAAEAAGTAAAEAAEAAKAATAAAARAAATADKTGGASMQSGTSRPVVATATPMAPPFAARGGEWGGFYNDGPYGYGGRGWGDYVPYWSRGYGMGDYYYDFPYYPARESLFWTGRPWGGFCSDDPYMSGGYLGWGGSFYDLWAPWGH
jgi:hypothetical protein